MHYSTYKISRRYSFSTFKLQIIKMNIDNSQILQDLEQIKPFIHKDRILVFDTWTLRLLSFNPFYFYQF